MPGVENHPCESARVQAGAIHRHRELEARYDMAPITTSPASAPQPTSLDGGLALTWLLGDDPRTITTKTGEKRTVIELRDPARLSQSLVIWLDGEAESLPQLRTGVPVCLHVVSVRSGRGRGELVANVSRASLISAFERARDDV